MKLGMSQKDLADKVSLTSSFISQLENDQISPSLNSFYADHGALGIPPSQLLQKSAERSAAPSWLITREAIRSRTFGKRGCVHYLLYCLNGTASAYITILHREKQ